MTEMEAAILYGREDVRVERVPIPPVERGEVRIRIMAALTCGTDVKVFRRGYHARMLTPPCPFGHEFAGEIDAVGEGVTGWRECDRVTAANSAPCGDCFYCERLQPGLCDDLLFVNGAYAQYITLPPRIVEKNLLRIPDSLSFEAAALAEPLACAVLGVEDSRVAAGQTVAVIGAGPLGLMIARLCVLAGARVVCIGRNPKRLAAAERMGAEAVPIGRDPVTHVRNACNAGRGPDRVIECVGSAETWRQALSMARKGGLVNLFGGCPSGSRIELETDRIHYDSLTICSTFHHTPDSVRTALTMLVDGSLPHEVLITDCEPLRSVPKVLRKLAGGGGNLKVAIKPNG